MRTIRKININISTEIYMNIISDIEVYIKTINKISATRAIARRRNVYFLIFYSSTFYYSILHIFIPLSQPLSLSLSTSLSRWISSQVVFVRICIWLFVSLLWGNYSDKGPDDSQGERNNELEYD